MLGWSPTGWVYESSDGGQSWREASSGLPRSNGSLAPIRQVLFSPTYAGDGLIYLVPAGRGIYKRVGSSPWLPVTTSEVPATPAPLPTPTPAPLPTPTRAPLPTPTRAACAVEPVRFKAVWQSPGVGERLGCPQQEAEALFLAEQPFEHGRMIWDSGTTAKRVYVLLDSGTWQAFADTFTEGVDPEYDPALPPPPRQPVRGFGKVWREQLGGPQAAIGWALEAERGVPDGWRQPFEGGLLVWTDAAQGTAYLLYGDGTWQAVAVPSGGG